MALRERQLCSDTGRSYSVWELVLSATTGHSRIPLNAAVHPPHLRKMTLMAIHLDVAAVASAAPVPENKSLYP